MNEFNDDEVRHKKKSKKKKPKKSNHKHEYVLVEKEKWVIEGWFTHREICKICGKKNNWLRADNI